MENVLKPGLYEAYQATLPRLAGKSFDDFKAELGDAEVHAIYVGESICGAVIIIGNEIHACILPWAEGRWFSRKVARILNSVIDKHGEAKTHATTEKGREFVLALGFVESQGIYRSKKKWALNRSSAQ